MAASSAPGTDTSDQPEPATLPADPSTPRRRRKPRKALVLAAVGVLLGVFVVAVVVSNDHSGSAPDKPRFTVTALSPKPGATVPHKASPVPARLAEWSAGIADKTDIPVRVVLAYGTAEVKMRKLAPRCRLSWTTLAGLGRVESSHGRHDGSEVRPDGTQSEPIVGVPLDGHEGVQAIEDTDGGELDGDPVWDRAVGAMQFVPTTWRKWGMRASGDGRAPDPQNIDDAALTAAHYLCDKGGDLATPHGWWDGVFAYNKSTSYGRKVFSGADAYARVNVSA